MNAWSDLSWIAIGDRVRHVDKWRATGRVSGWSRPDGSTAWLVVGALGRVVEVHPGSAAHRCPGQNHDDDCYCSGDRVIPERASYAVVEYEAEDGGVGVRRAIMQDEEGGDWRRESEIDVKEGNG